jgi:hypothetical protein
MYSMAHNTRSSGKLRLGPSINRMGLNLPSSRLGHQVCQLARLPRGPPWPTEYIHALGLPIWYSPDTLLSTTSRLKELFLSRPVASRIILRNFDRTQGQQRLDWYIDPLKGRRLSWFMVHGGPWLLSFHEWPSL